MPACPNLLKRFFPVLRVPPLKQFDIYLWRMSSELMLKNEYIIWNKYIFRYDVNQWDQQTWARDSLMADPRALIGQRQNFIFSHCQNNQTKIQKIKFRDFSKNVVWKSSYENSPCEDFVRIGIAWKCCRNTW